MRSSAPWSQAPGAGGPQPDPDPWQCGPGRRNLVGMQDGLGDVRARGGLLLPEDVAALRAGHRRSLVLVQPRVRLAASQPVDALTVVRAVDLSVTGHLFAGTTALWLYDLAPPPARVDVAVPASRQLVLLPPARVRRTAPSLLRGARSAGGFPVVGLETAVVQSAVELGAHELLAVLEEVLRRRASTQHRLLRSCRRGVAGSTAVRRAVAELADGDLDELVRLLRQALVVAGVQALEAEVPVRSSTGATAYLDLLHRPSRTAIEVDGWSTHSRRDRFVADRRRDRWVQRELGIRTVRVAADEVRSSLSSVVAELVQVLGTGGAAARRA